MAEPTSASLQVIISKAEEKVWRVGRVAEGGGLLNRYRVKSSIGGSNPPLSAIILKITIAYFLLNRRWANAPDAASGVPTVSA